MSDPFYTVKAFKDGVPVHGVSDVPFLDPGFAADLVRDAQAMGYESWLEHGAQRYMVTPTEVYPVEIH